MPDLVISNLSASYDGRGRRHAVLHDVDLLVPHQSVLGVVGESGSGKSTLGRVVVGLLRPDSGDVRLGNETISDGRKRPGRLQMVFQDPRSSLNPRLTVAQTLSEVILHSRRTRRSQVEGEVTRLLKEVAMPPSSAHVLPSELSGGQRQRVAIARALASAPDLLVADEITSALDVSVQAGVLNVLRSVLRDLGIPVLFISHDLPVVRYMSDNIAVLRHGRVVEYGPAERVINQPQTAYTAQLIEASMTDDEV